MSDQVEQIKAILSKLEYLISLFEQAMEEDEEE